MTSQNLMNIKPETYKCLAAPSRRMCSEMILSLYSAYFLHKIFALMESQESPYLKYMLSVKVSPAIPKLWQV